MAQQMAQHFEDYSMAPKKSVALTDTKIAKAKPKIAESGKRAGKPMVTRLYDGASPGLQVVINTSGGKTFAYRYASPTITTVIAGGTVPARRSMSLGQYPDMSLADARTEIESLRTMIRGGIDPIDQNVKVEREQATEAAVGTVEDLFDYYLQRMENEGRKSVGKVRLAYKRNIAPIGQMRACDVTGKDIADKVLKPMFKRGSDVQANRVRSYLFTAFQTGLLAANSAKYDAPDFKLVFNPVTTVPIEGKESVGRRWLDEAEVKRLWNEIGTPGNMTKDSAIAVKLILSTGQRVEEVLHATWDEFDFESNVWEIPASRRKTSWKTDSDTDSNHIVPLCDLHLELLEELKGMAKRQKYLFPAPDGKSPRESAGLRQAVGRYCTPQGVSKREPFEYFTPKNLRTTFKTLGGKAKVSKEIRDRLQGHSLSDLSSRHYDKYKYLDEKKAGMERWCKWLSRQVGTKPGKVVPFRREA